MIEKEKPVVCLGCFVFLQKFKTIKLCVTINHGDWAAPLN